MYKLKIVNHFFLWTYLDRRNNLETCFTSVRFQALDLLDLLDHPSKLSDRDISTMLFSTLSFEIGRRLTDVSSLSGSHTLGGTLMISFNKQEGTVALVLVTL